MKDNDAIRCRKPIIGRAERDNDSSHLRVDIAEDVGDAFAVKLYNPTCVGFIEPKIESLAIKQRKYVMKERVEVRKVDVASSGNYQDVRAELLILLSKRKNLFMHLG